MDGNETRRDKSKAFKATAETVERINRLIKQSGKGDTEFFEELVHELEVERLTSDENDDIPVDLRRSFQQDVQKLKNATNSIISLYTSQMENIAVEKDRWAFSTGKQIAEREEKLAEQTEKLNSLKTDYSLLNEELTRLLEVNENTEKERDALLKQLESQEKLATAREEKIEDMTDRINKLNGALVAKEEELQQTESLQEENRTLHTTIEELNRQLEALEVTRQTEISTLEQSIEELAEQHEAAQVRQAEVLRFEFDKEQLELQKQAAAAQEQVRAEAREKAESMTSAFYTKEIERMQTAWAQEEADYRAQIDDLRKQVQQGSRRADSDKED